MNQKLFPLTKNMSMPYTQLSRPSSKQKMMLIHPNSENKERLQQNIYKLVEFLCILQKRKKQKMIKQWCFMKIKLMKQKMKQKQMTLQNLDRLIRRKNREIKLKGLICIKLKSNNVQLDQNINEWKQISKIQQKYGKQQIEIKLRWFNQKWEIFNNLNNGLLGKNNIKNILSNQSIKNQQSLIKEINNWFKTENDNLSPQFRKLKNLLVKYIQINNQLYKSKNNQNIKIRSSNSYQYDQLIQLIKSNKIGQLKQQKYKFYNYSKLIDVLIQTSTINNSKIPNPLDTKYLKSISQKALQFNNQIVLINNNNIQQTIIQKYLKQVKILKQKLLNSQNQFIKQFGIIINTQDKIRQYYHSQNQLVLAKQTSRKFKSPNQINTDDIQTQNYQLLKQIQNLKNKLKDSQQTKKINYRHRYNNFYQQKKQTKQQESQQTQKYQQLSSKQSIQKSFNSTRSHKNRSTRRYTDRQQDDDKKQSRSTNKQFTTQHDVKQLLKQMQNQQLNLQLKTFSLQISNLQQIIKKQNMRLNEQSKNDEKIRELHQKIIILQEELSKIRESNNELSNKNTMLNNLCLKYCKQIMSLMNDEIQGGKNGEQQLQRMYVRVKSNYEKLKVEIQNYSNNEQGKLIKQLKKQVSHYKKIIQKDIVNKNSYQMQYKLQKLYQIIKQKNNIIKKLKKNHANYNHSQNYSDSISEQQQVNTSLEFKIQTQLKLQSSNKLQFSQIQKIHHLHQSNFNTLDQYDLQYQIHALQLQKLKLKDQLTKSNTQNLKLNTKLNSLKNQLDLLRRQKTLYLNLLKKQQKLGSKQFEDKKSSFYQTYKKKNNSKIIDHKIIQDQNIIQIQENEINYIKELQKLQNTLTQPISKGKCNIDLQTIRAILSKLIHYLIENFNKNLICKIQGMKQLVGLIGYSQIKNDNNLKKECLENLTNLIKQIWRSSNVNEIRVIKCLEEQLIKAIGFESVRQILNNIQRKKQ